MHRWLTHGFKGLSRLCALHATVWPSYYGMLCHLAFSHLYPSEPLSFHDSQEETSYQHSPPKNNDTDKNICRLMANATRKAKESDEKKIAARDIRKVTLVRVLSYTPLLPSPSFLFISLHIDVKRILANEKTNCGWSFAN